MNRRELRERIGVLGARLEWLARNRPPPPDGDTDHVIRETDVWTYGITERADGTFSSVWMKVRRD